MLPGKSHRQNIRDIFFAQMKSYHPMDTSALYIKMYCFLKKKKNRLMKMYHLINIKKTYVEYTFKL